jgi:Matrixin
MSEYTSEPVWASGTITYSFADTTYAQDVFHPFDATLDAADQAIVNQAIEAWEKVSGLTFVEVADSSNPADAADIRIGFSDLNTQSTGTVGWTSWTSNGGTFNPDVVVQLENPAQLALTGSASNPTYQGTSATLLQLAEHEIGHAIGLGENMTDQTSIEYPLATGGDQALDATDIAAVQALYGPPSPAFIGGSPGPVSASGAEPVGSGAEGQTFVVQAGDAAGATWRHIGDFVDGDALDVMGLRDPARIDWIGVRGTGAERGATFEAHARDGAVIKVTLAGMTMREASHLAVSAGVTDGRHFVEVGG